MTTLHIDFLCSFGPVPVWCGAKRLGLTGVSSQQSPQNRSLILRALVKRSSASCQLTTFHHAVT